MVGDGLVVTLGEIVVLEAILGRNSAAAAVEAFEGVVVATAPRVATTTTTTLVKNVVLAARHQEHWGWPFFSS
jgi:hypothetical protein